MNRGQYDAVSKNPRMSKSNIQFTFFLSIADTEAKNSHRQRIQRIVLASPWPESVGESQKILFVDPIEDDHHGPLDNLVFQCRDPDRSLPPVGLWDVYPPGWLRSIRAPMHPAVQISQSFCQSGFILLPGHPIHSRRRFPFQSVEAVTQE